MNWSRPPQGKSRWAAAPKGHAVRVAPQPLLPGRSAYSLVQLVAAPPCLPPTPNFVLLGEPPPPTAAVSPSSLAGPPAPPLLPLASAFHGAAPPAGVFHVLPPVPAAPAPAAFLIVDPALLAEMPSSRAAEQSLGAPAAAAAPAQPFAAQAPAPPPPPTQQYFVPATPQQIQQLAQQGTIIIPQTQPHTFDQSQQPAFRHTTHIFAQPKASPFRALARSEQPDQQRRFHAQQQQGSGAFLTSTPRSAQAGQAYEQEQFQAAPQTTLFLPPTRRTEAHTSGETTDESARSTPLPRVRIEEITDRTSGAESALEQKRTDQEASPATPNVDDDLVFARPSHPVRKAPKTNSRPLVSVTTPPSSPATCHKHAQSPLLGKKCANQTSPSSLNKETTRRVEQSLTDSESLPDARERNSSTESTNSYSSEMERMVDNLVNNSSSQEDENESGASQSGAPNAGFSNAAPASSAPAVRVVRSRGRGRGRSARVGRPARVDRPAPVERQLRVALNRVAPFQGASDQPSWMQHKEAFTKHLQDMLTALEGLGSPAAEMQRLSFNTLRSPMPVALNASLDEAGAEEFRRKVRDGLSGLRKLLPTRRARAPELLAVNDFVDTLQSWDSATDYGTGGLRSNDCDLVLRTLEETRRWMENPCPEKSGVHIGRRERNWRTSASRSVHLMMHAVIKALCSTPMCDSETQTAGDLQPSLETSALLALPSTEPDPPERGDAPSADARTRSPSPVHSSARDDGSGDTGDQPPGPPVHYAATPTSRPVRRSADGPSVRVRRAAQHALAQPRKVRHQTPDAAARRSSYPPPRAGEFRQSGRPPTAAQGDGRGSGEAPADALLTKTRLVNLTRSGVAAPSAPATMATKTPAFRGREAVRSLPADRPATARKSLSVPYRPPSPPARNSVGRPQQNFQDHRPTGRSKTKSTEPPPRNGTAERLAMERDSSEDGRCGTYIKKGTYSPPLRKPGSRAAGSSGEDQAHLTSPEHDSNDSNSPGIMEPLQMPERGFPRWNRPLSRDVQTQASDSQFHDCATEVSPSENVAQSLGTENVTQIRRPQHTRPTTQKENMCAPFRSAFRNGLQEPVERTNSDTSHCAQNNCDAQHIPLVRIFPENLPNASSSSTLAPNTRNRIHELPMGLNLPEHAQINRMESERVQENGHVPLRYDNCCPGAHDQRANYSLHSTPSSRYGGNSSNQEVPYRFVGQVISGLDNNGLPLARCNFSPSGYENSYQNTNVGSERRPILQERSPFQNGSAARHELSGNVPGRSCCPAMPSRTNGSYGVPHQSYLQELQASREHHMYNSTGSQRPNASYRMPSPRREGNRYPVHQDGSFHSRLGCQGTLETTDLSPIPNNGQLCREVNVSFDPCSSSVLVQMPPHSSSGPAECDELSHGLHSSTRRNVTLPNSSGSHSNFLNQNHVSPPGACIGGRTFHQLEQMNHHQGRSYQPSMMQRNGPTVAESRAPYWRDPSVHSSPAIPVWGGSILEGNNWNSRENGGVFSEGGVARSVNHQPPAGAGWKAQQRLPSYNEPRSSYNHDLPSCSMRDSPPHHGNCSREPNYYVETKSSSSSVLLPSQREYDAPTAYVDSMKSETEPKEEDYVCGSMQGGSNANETRRSNCTHFRGARQADSAPFVRTGGRCESATVSANSVSSREREEEEDGIEFLWEIVRNRNRRERSKENFSGGEPHLKKEPLSNEAKECVESETGRRNPPQQPECLDQAIKVESEREAARERRGELKRCVVVLETSPDPIVSRCETRSSNVETATSPSAQGGRFRKPSGDDGKGETAPKNVSGCAPSNDEGNVPAKETFPPSPPSSPPPSSERLNKESAEVSSEEQVMPTTSADAESPSQKTTPSGKRKREAQGDTTPPMTRKMAPSVAGSPTSVATDRQAETTSTSPQSAPPSPPPQAKEPYAAQPQQQQQSPGPRGARFLGENSRSCIDEEMISPERTPQRIPEVTNTSFSQKEYCKMTRCLQAIWDMQISRDIFFCRTNKVDDGDKEEPQTLLDVAHNLRTGNYGHISAFVQDVRRILDGPINGNSLDAPGQAIRDIREHFETTLAQTYPGTINTSATPPQTTNDGSHRRSNRLVFRHDFLERLCDARTMSMGASAETHPAELRHNNYARRGCRRGRGRPRIRSSSDSPNTGNRLFKNTQGLSVPGGESETAEQTPYATTNTCRPKPRTYLRKSN